MKLFGFVSCFPTFLETDKENFFETVNFEGKNSAKTFQYCQKSCNTPVIESVKTSRKKKVSNSIEHSGEKDSEDFRKTSQSQYNYLSSNLVETNAHVLGLYKKIKEFETNSLMKMKNDIEILSHKVEEGSCLSAPESEQINTQTDIIYLYHKLDKLSDTVKQLESRLLYLQEERNSEQGGAVFQILNGSENSVPLSGYDQVMMTPSDGWQPSQTHQSNLLRFLLPSVVTVTAIVVNMFLYVSSSARKFPY